ncbi:hypothetical protein FQA39_LY11438 [Lamprigera yunnana]|nr:hypothetical protein FQA39_LY11438 [Lamprigera yunnana]
MDPIPPDSFYGRGTFSTLQEAVNAVIELDLPSTENVPLVAIPPSPDLETDYDNLISLTVMSPNSREHAMDCLPRGGVVSNAPLAASAGSGILLKGGSAVDAMITTLLCEGVLIPNCMGIGGGFIMNIYDYKTKTCKVLNSRETAPADATENMYENNPAGRIAGGLSTAIPGELIGYWEAHKKYGKLPWEDLVKPAIKFARYGFKVNRYLETVLADFKDVLLKDPGLREVYINPCTNLPYKQNDLIISEKLANTLEIISKEGGKALHNGSLTDDFVEDVRNLGGIITVEDMNNYRPLWCKPLKTKLSNKHTVCAVPTPGSGAIFILILNILDGFLDLENFDTVHNWHKIIESFKFAYGRRTELGDSNVEPCVDDLVSLFTSKEYAQKLRKKISIKTTCNNPCYYGANLYDAEDKGTCSPLVLAPNGDAVAATSTINTDFGAGVTSQSTGIILNNEMSDFSVPHMESYYKMNFIKPGKRPMSSVSPSIILDKYGDVALVLGGCGGSKTTTGCALVALKKLFYNYPIKTAVESKRLLHQLVPMEIMADTDFDKNIIKGLKKLRHKIKFKESRGFETITAIGTNNKVASGAFDPRRGGELSVIS